MKNVFTTFLMFLTCLFSIGQNPLVGVDHSVFSDSESLTDVWGYGVPTAYPIGHNTYRVHAYLDDATSVLQSVIGVPDALETFIGTDIEDGYLWNYPSFGVSSADNITDAFIGTMADGGTIMYDSYVTIGIENNVLPAGQTGISFGIGESNVPIGVYWGTENYSDLENPDFIMTNDAWILTDVTGTNAYGIGPDFAVLLAQITTTAEDIHYGLNITVLTDVPLSGGDTWISYWDPSGMGGTTFMEADGSEMGLKYPSCEGLYGCMDVTACNYDSTALCDDDSCGYAGCMDISACNYDSSALCEDGSCSGTLGCLDNTACNYDSTATCDDGSCEGFFGCMDSAFCNFDPLATCDDSSCAGYAGCMDSLACNFDSLASCDDGTCSGEVGCIDPAACNFDSTAVCDDGSCSGLGGCMDSTACNFDSTANCEDGSCAYPGCIDDAFCNFDSSAGCDDGSCEGLPGCTYVAASNYNSLADCDDGSCFDTMGCTDPEACNYESTATVDNESCTYPGCMIPSACNYDSLAECSDDYCTFPGCTSQSACNYNNAAGCNDGSCFGVSACMDEEACNYDSSATCDDGTCYSGDCGDFLVDIIVEEFYDYDQAVLDGIENYPEDATTYRVYARLLDETIAINIFYGIGENYLHVNTSDETIWFHDILSDEIGGSVQESFIDAFGVPEAYYSSYLTIGKEYQDDPGCNISAVGPPFGSEGNWGVEGGTGFTIDDEFGGSWYSLGTDCENQFGQGEDFRVLIMQITSTGTPQFNLNTSTQKWVDGEQVDVQEFDWNTDYGIEKGLVYPAFNCDDVAACNYNQYPELDVDNSSCSYTCYGCTDTDFCNYSSLASIDDGSCFGNAGCTDPEANNYDSDVECSSNFCEYNVNGVVFFDENVDGSFNGVDYPLPFEIITIAETGSIAITNDEGQFYFNNVTPGVYTVELTLTEDYPASTTINPVTLVVQSDGSSNNIDFGLISEDIQYQICVDYYSGLPGYPCNDFINHNVCYRNEGNVPVDGIVAIEMSELFQGYIQVTPIDSVIGNVIYMSFEDLMPGQMFFYDVIFHTPTVDFIGEYLTSTASVFGYDELGNLVASGSEELVVEMTCSYDPNDKQVFPGGYAEPHYILNGTELEYLIRFQNTGNADAMNVTVRDTLDINLDMSTFALMANSHSVMTTLDPETRAVEFFFENIMLPDSLSDEEGSNGLVSFLIRPYEDLPYETVINNTGFIYFDNNPPIVTNTTWNTIYDCNESLADFNLSDAPYCVGSEITATSNADFIEDYQWEINDFSQMIDEEVMSYALPEPQSYEIKLTASNPICEAIQTITIDAIESPEILVSGEDEICVGESLNLVASGGIDYVWNTEETSEDIEVSPEETTIYEVTGYNEEGCSDSEEVTVVIIPGPTLDLTENTEICPGEEIELSVTGGNSYLWSTEEETENIQVSPLETTTYEVTGFNEEGCSETEEVIVIVNPLPEASFTDAGALLTAIGADAYQWYLNGELIDGATQQTYTAEENGDYSVAVWNEAGCSAISDSITVTIISVNEIELSEFNLYPNPITSSSVLDLKNQGNYAVQIYDATGKLVRDYGTIDSDKLLIQKEGLSRGVYYLWIIEKRNFYKLSIEIQ